MLSLWFASGLGLEFGFGFGFASSKVALGQIRSEIAKRPPLGSGCGCAIVSRPSFGICEVHTHRLSISVQIFDIFTYIWTNADLIPNPIPIPIRIEVWIRIGIIAPLAWGRLPLPNWPKLIRVDSGLGNAVCSASFPFSRPIFRTQLKLGAGIWIGIGKVRCTHTENRASIVFPLFENWGPISYVNNSLPHVW